jgi:lipid II isoglutaminyl synthase (glutamine-hydrolysing)
MKLVIGYLYGDLMNIYGDSGNIIALTKRAEWRGIEVEVRNISTGDNLSTKDCDLFFFGGGQDQAQELVAKDLQKKAKVLKLEVERGIPLLSICGGYQLLGEYYLPRLPAGKAGQPAKGPKLPGIGLFPAYTIAGETRMIGNIVIELTSSPVNQLTSQLIVGFENHSGKTYLKDGTKPLGTVKSGFGNNGEDHTEGCVYKNAIGCYMHGSLLPKNPTLTDWLIKKALEVKYGEIVELKPLDDTLENEAHKTAIQKFS